MFPIPNLEKLDELEEKLQKPEFKAALGPISELESVKSSVGLGYKVYA